MWIRSNHEGIISCTACSYKISIWSICKIGRARDEKKERKRLVYFPDLFAFTPILKVPV
jgi:hypothetical protein